MQKLAVRTTAHSAFVNITRDVQRVIAESGVREGVCHIFVLHTTSGLLKILDNAGNLDDLIGFMTERFLPVDEIQANELASEILRIRPEVGCLTISNALQWRLSCPN